MYSDVEYLTTATMNRNKKKYKWCNYWNNDNGALVYHWNIGHKKRKEKQARKKSAHFSDTANNVVIYQSCLVDTSEKYLKE